MAVPYSVDNYLHALKALLPPGRVWQAAFGSVQAKVLKAFASSFARVDSAAIALLEDAFPASADGLLPEWEETTGLPDPCAGPSPTLQQREGQVVARFANAGGQSAAFYIAYAANLGFAITVSNYAPFKTGETAVGQPLCSVAWASAWSVTAPANSPTCFRTDLSAVGEPLNAYGNAVLECEFAALQPAHTTLVFNFV